MVTNTSVYNDVGIGSVFPAGGDSLGLVGTSIPADQAGAGSASNAGAGAGAGDVNVFKGNIIAGFLTLAGFVLLIMLFVHFVGRKGGAEGDFANIKSTFYNVLLISLVAAAGEPAWGYVFDTLAGWGIPLAPQAATYIRSR